MKFPSNGDSSDSVLACFSLHGFAEVQLLKVFNCKLSLILTVLTDHLDPMLHLFPNTSNVFKPMALTNQIMMLSTWI